MDLEELRESFQDFSSAIPEHRIERNKLHSINEILFLTLSAIICGCEGWRDIERFGLAKINFLRTLFPFTHGVPSDDTLRRFFRALDPDVFRNSFVDWIKTLNLPEKLHIAIDGKVSRHTFDGDNNPLHLVSAFSSECRLVLAQEKVSDKSNEITAIPKLLPLLDLKEAIVTIDAMGCQREIAQHIMDKEAHYILALKGNQSALHQDVQLMFNNLHMLNNLDIKTHQTFDGSEHGRKEKRLCRVVICPDVLKQQHNWPGLKTLIEIQSTRDVINGKSSEESRYYISSLEPNAELINQTIRSHWAIENTLHWILDVSFRDDDSRIRKGNAPQNIAIIKHMALNLLQKAKGKRDSIKQLRKAAGWDDLQLLKILNKI